MRDQQDGLPPAFEIRELVEALVREALVADREHLVDQQHFRIDVDRHREPEAHVHAGGVCLDRRVDELLHLGELDDLFEALGDLALCQAEHDPVDEDVLAAGYLRVKSGAELDERGDPSVHSHRAARRLRDAGHELQERALARSVAADYAERASPGYRQIDVVQRRERLVGPQVLDQAARQQRALQRRELLALAVAAVDFCDPRDFDGGFRGPWVEDRGAPRVRCQVPIVGPRSAGRDLRPSLLGHYTSSAKESRRRSKTPYAIRNHAMDATPRAPSHFQCPNGPGKNRIS